MRSTNTKTKGKLNLNFLIIHTKVCITNRPTRLPKRVVCTESWKALLPKSVVELLEQANLPQVSYLKDLQSFESGEER